MDKGNLMPGAKEVLCWVPSWWGGAKTKKEKKRKGGGSRYKGGGGGKTMYILHFGPPVSGKGGTPLPKR